MKKLALTLLVVGTLGYSKFIFSAVLPHSDWSGFYLGGNGGYWHSLANHITSTGTVNFINPVDEPGASNIANALVQLANNSSSLHSYGVIAGGQLGYNYEFDKGFLLGLNVDLDGLSNSNNSTTLQKTVNLVDFAESYVGTLTVRQKINYLSTVRARFGYLYTPTFLVYATGGVAFGNVTLDTALTAQESLGSAVFPTITAQRNVTKTLPGWVAGAGIEWLFKPQWSALLEYTYYSLNNYSVSTTLAQTNASISPPVLWGSATANTAASLSFWAIKFGINYHFS